MLTIDPRKIDHATVRVPGSKSYTHRLLIGCALASGTSTLANPLISEDTRFTARALEQMGAQIELQEGGARVQGSGGRLRSAADPIYLGNSGTSMRLLTAIAGLGRGPYRLEGTPRMHQRPIGALLEGLAQIGVAAWAVNGDDCPPVVVDGTHARGGAAILDCSLSSQFLSGMLLMAPCLSLGLEIRVARGPVSKPYLDLTLEIMAQLGIRVERQGYRRFAVPGGQAYAAGDYRVEPDCSGAGYFWAAAAVTGGSVTVRDISPGTRQGDMGLVTLLEQMGCRVQFGAQGVTVTGGDLRAIECDMGDMPDMVPTLAVVAAFARGTTRIGNVAHLKAKESDRLGAVAAELARLGVTVATTPDSLSITGGIPRGAHIRTYDDHRMAMAFAVAGLRVPGLSIENPGCVAKSFPNFWDLFQRL
jgi:3-phosphoshikimate 1-carboxyvinyltransferase